MGFGRSAEALAAKHLKKRGYRIVAKNYSCVRGEIDLIALDGEVVVFVEVKARSTGDHGEAAQAITGLKRRRLVAAAEHYLLAHPTERSMRFDVVSMTADEVLVIEDAFSADSEF